MNEKLFMFINCLK